MISILFKVIIISPILLFSPYLFRPSLDWLSFIYFFFFFQSLYLLNCFLFIYLLFLFIDNLFSSPFPLFIFCFDLFSFYVYFFPLVLYIIPFITLYPWPFFFLKKNLTIIKCILVSLCCFACLFVCSEFQGLSESIVLFFFFFY